MSNANGVRAVDCLGAARGFADSQVAIGSSLALRVPGLVGLVVRCLAVFVLLAGPAGCASSGSSGGEGGEVVGAGKQALDLGGDLMGGDLGGDLGGDGFGSGALEMQWAPDLVAESLSPGEVRVLTVQFTPTGDTGAVHFAVSPELDGFVSVEPSTLWGLEAWQPQTVELHLSVPEGTPDTQLTGYVSMHLDDEEPDPMADPLGGLGGDWGDLGDQGIPLPLLVDLSVEAFTIQITSPQSLITVGSFPIAVTGTASSPDAVITVNGIEVPNQGGTFTASAALEEGHNTIVARAVLGEKQATDSVSVSLDLTPPYVTIESHMDGQTVHSEEITVTGLINDIVRGTVEQSQVEVSVNGLPATVSNRSYSVTGVPLQPGANTITVTGTDQVGNVGTAEIVVTYEVLQGHRLELVSGDGQTAHISEVLSAPLVVRVLDDQQQPVGSKHVVFRVTQGAGALQPGTADEARAAAVLTDGSGLASVQFRVGTRSGTANQKVRAKVVGYDDEVVFNASALANIGNKLSVNSGNNQRGSTGQVLPEPLVVVVTDDGANVVQGARVQFDVTKGDGLLQNGALSYVVTTDSDGRATTEYTLGPLSGIDAQRITATLLDGPPGEVIKAGFTETAFVAGDPGQTSISGVVLDNQDNPLAGVTIRVDGTSRQAVADAEGQFRISEAPVGAVHLIADGSTASGPGEYPSLSYNLVTIPGVDNPLSAPIYMVKLDTDSAVYAGPQDVTLELPHYPGFKLEIAAGSATFPNGAKEGQISVTAVNASKVPMAPPNGMQPQFIVTIQPTGTRFDPPARLTLPNVDGHAPGTQTEMYSYDHDLEEFVSIGLGTVSEDGTVIASNPGVGVVKAGWHCGSQPTGQGCAHNCPVCQDCDGNCNCVPAAGDPRLASQDTPEDCKKPECSNGSVTQVNDDSDVPPDTPGDCKMPECQSGSPGEVNDDSDVPPDTPGDCKMPECKNGSAGEANDDTDVPPDQPCKECSAGTLGDKSDPAAAFAAASATLAIAAPSIPISGCVLGLTYPESVSVGISVRCDGGSFKAELTSMTGNYSLQANLIPGATEVTGPGGNTTAANYCTQVTELSAVICPGGNWDMVGSTQAHEQVHLTRFEPALEAVAATIEASFEALSVPATPGKTPAQAKTEIEAQPAFAAAVAAAQQTWLAEVLVRVANDHNPGGLTTQAERGVYDPMIATICAHAKAQGWAPCAICPP